MTDKQEVWKFDRQFSFTQTLLSIAQLTGDCPVMHEILQLANLEGKVNQVIDQYLSFDVSDSYTGLIPSILWANLTLGWNTDRNRKFWEKSFRIILANKVPLTFSSKVLLS